MLAGGCFWGVQAVFQHTKGVINAVSGYAGGNRSTAQYETVSNGASGHAESVQITYDPRQITYGQLLQVFFSVVQCGSMAKAAHELGVTQPAVSEVVAGLEHAFGVRLFDRSPHGVEPTVYGRALLKRGVAAFDELKQGIRDIEFLATG